MKLRAHVLDEIATAKDADALQALIDRHWRARRGDRGRLTCEEVEAIHRAAFERL